MYKIAKYFTLKELKLRLLNKVSNYFTASFLYVRDDHNITNILLQINKKSINYEDLVEVFQYIYSNTRFPGLSKFIYGNYRLLKNVLGIIYYALILSLEKNLLFNDYYLESLRFRELAIQTPRSLFFFEAGYFYNVRNNRFDHDFNFGRCNIFLDKKFLSLIKGKSVAIVGPATNRFDIKDELESFDLVVRINRFTNVERFSTGSRVNIIYVNEESAKKVKTELIDNGKHWIVHKGINPDSESATSRQMNFCPYLLSGFALNGINAIYDILLYQPIRLKVFNMDLYISYDSYEDKERNALLRGDTLKRLIDHDLIAHHEFLNYLYKAKIIETDITLGNIVTLSAEDFYTKLLELN